MFECPSIHQHFIISYHLRYFYKTSHQCKTPWEALMRECAEHMKCNSGLSACGVITHWTLNIAISTMYLCPLNNSDTVRDIFMKLHTNVKHDRRHAEHMNHNYGLPSFGVIALWIWNIAISSNSIYSCPLCKVKTIWDIFMKSHTNVKHHETMYRTQES